MKFKSLPIPFEHYRPTGDLAEKVVQILANGENLLALTDQGNIWIWADGDSGWTPFPSPI